MSVRLRRVWVVVVALTIGMWWASGSRAHGPVLSAVVVIATMAKVGCVAWWWVEVDRSPTWLRATWLAWAGAVAAIVYLGANA